jgi:hypothetical protein
LVNRGSRRGPRADSAQRRRVEGCIAQRIS